MCGAGSAPGRYLWRAGDSREYHDPGNNLLTGILLTIPSLIGSARGMGFFMVALYPLLKWGIAVLITIPLCFLVSLVIRKIPLVNRVV